MDQQSSEIYQFFILFHQKKFLIVDFYSFGSVKKTLSMTYILIPKKIHISFEQNIFVNHYFATIAND